jgi:hypothetical protein
MHLIITIWIIVAVWYFGERKQFPKTHATMLYMSGMNLLYLVLTAEYPLWRIQPEFGIPNALIVILYSFVIFPATIFLFLSRFPQTRIQKILHICKWIFIYFIVEWIGSLFGRITYQHGWHLGWSFLFLLVMFPMLVFHSRKPIWAYAVSLVVIAVLMHLFNVPSTGVIK